MELGRAIEIAELYGHAPGTPRPHGGDEVYVRCEHENCQAYLTWWYPENQPEFTDVGGMLTHMCPVRQTERGA